VVAVLTPVQAPVEVRCWIYGLCDPETGELRYVGRTDDVRRRFAVHLSAARTSGHKSRCAAWIKSLLLQGKEPEVDVLDYVPADQAHHMEREYIALWRYLIGDRLTNLTDGGDGLLNPSPEVRARMSAAAKARGTSQAQLDGLDRGRRTRFGEKNPLAVLTETEVFAIRHQAEDGWTFQELADEYGVSFGTIPPIVYGRTWRHVGGPVREAKRHLTEAEVLEICRRSDGGASRRELAAEYKVTVPAIRYILIGKSWTHVTGRNPLNAEGLMR
jgi:hypothetical protein